MTASPKPRKRRAHALTPKSLGLVDDVKLSKSYANSRTSFKTVSDIVIGYYVTIGGSRAPVRIAPIYRADVWLRKTGTVGTNQIITSHEIGEYYNPQRRDDDEPDVDGDALAHVASTALAALERHAAYERAKRTLTKTSTKRTKRTNKVKR